MAFFQLIHFIIMVATTIKLAKQNAAVQALATTKYQTINEKRFALTTISQICAWMGNDRIL